MEGELIRHFMYAKKKIIYRITDCESATLKIAEFKIANQSDLS